MPESERGHVHEGIGPAEEPGEAIRDAHVALDDAHLLGQSGSVGSMADQSRDLAAAPE